MYISICLLFLSQYFCTSLSYTSYTFHNSHNVLSSHLQLIYNTISIKYTYGALALKYKLSRWRTHMGFWLGIPKRNMGLNGICGTQYIIYEYVYMDWITQKLGILKLRTHLYVYREDILKFQNLSLYHHPKGLGAFIQSIACINVVGRKDSKVIPRSE